MANRNPRGYLSKANKRLTAVGFRLPPATVKKMDIAAAAAGLTKRQFAARAIDQLADAILSGAHDPRKSASERRQPPQADPTPAEYRYDPHFARKANGPI